MKEKFAREIIGGTSPRALELALAFYKESENKAREIVDNLENISRGEILSSLSLFPVESQARLLLYLALKGEPVKEKAVDMAGYLDGEGPDAVALRTVLGLEQGTGPERYLRYLRKNFQPYSLSACRLYATASGKLLSRRWNEDLFHKTLFCLRHCSDDFVRTPLLLPILEAARSHLIEVLDDVLDFQRGMLFDHERSKVLIKTAEVLKNSALLDRSTSEKILLAIREIETKVFRFWALKEVSKVMAEAGLRERAMEVARGIENPFWKGALSYELLREGERGEDLEDPFWKLMVDLKTHSERQGEILSEFMENPYIPDGIKLPSLEIVLPLISRENSERVRAFLDEKGWESRKMAEEPMVYGEEVSVEEFLKMPVADREEWAERLAESVEFNQEALPFFKEVLYHPKAVDIALSRKVKTEGEEEAQEIIRILQPRLDKNR